MHPEIAQFIREKPEMLKDFINEFIIENTKSGINIIDFIDTHAKQPILTTEDNYDVWNEKTELFCVNPITFATTELTAKRAKESACVSY